MIASVYVCVVFCVCVCVRAHTCVCVCMYSMHDSVQVSMLYFMAARTKRS